MVFKSVPASNLVESNVPTLRMRQLGGQAAVASPLVAAPLGCVRRIMLASSATELDASLWCLMQPSDDIADQRGLVDDPDVSAVLALVAAAQVARTHAFREMMHPMQLCLFARGWLRHAAARAA